MLTELPAAEVTTESELPTSEPETVAQSESPPSSLPASVVNLPLSATPAWLKDLLPKSVRAIQEEQPPAYQPKTATPTAALDRLLVFRSVNPLYGDFLLQQLGIADQVERIQALESVLEIPSSLFKQVRAPGPEELPPGPLATARLDKELLDRGLASPVDLDPSLEKEDDTPKFGERPPRRYALPFADKLRRLFDSDFPDVGEFRTLPVWVVGDLLHFGGDFQKYVTSQDLTKQEGLIFRHIMRMILLCSEFSELTPPETTEAEWRASLRSIADQLTVCCRVIDPESTDQMLETMKGADVTEGCINVAS